MSDGDGGDDELVIMVIMVIMDDELMEDGVDEKEYHGRGYW